MPHFNADAARLNAARRARELDGLRDSTGLADGETHVDLVVIGAGVTGAGVALDAATRGLDVLIVDAHDIAFGTSRWSSKLAHGGLRYLATGNVGIARRSALERGILMGTTAPHLTRPLTQVVPVQDRYTTGQKTAPRLGFIAGDALRIAARTPSSVLPSSKTVDKKTVAELCPAVDTSDLRFGYINHDGQLIDDARLVTALVRTAAGYGARVVTHCRAVEAHGDRVVLQDELDDAATPLTVTAGAVVNATGVWAGGLDPQVTVRPSRGTHLVIDADLVGNPTGALTVPVPGHSSRFCFILPEQLGRCYIGITDEDAGANIPDVPEVPDEDVRWILDVVNQALAVDITPDDVLGAFAGLRPLVQFTDANADGAGSTADLSREHVILTGEGEDANLVTVTGGKLTEYRLMAEQTVDLVADKLREDGATPGPCVTTSTPLTGAPGSAGVEYVQPSDLAGLPTSMVERFGHEAPAILRSCPVDRPLEPVAPGIDTVRAEFAWHVTHEAALTVEDLIDRRSRIGLVDADREACLATAQEILDAVG